MARNEQSNINFNIDITGVKEARELSKLLPKLIDQFKELEKAQSSYKNRTSSSGSGSSGTSVNKRRINEQMAKIELGVRKEDIDSVDHLTQYYGSLRSMISKVEKEGQSMNQMNLRAYKMYQRLRKEIQNNTKARKHHQKAVQQTTKSQQKAQQTMKGSMNGMKQSTNSLKSAGAEVEKQTDAVHNASYMLLNTGYLIQDSPYGIRGMANNISQLAQSYQMLSQRIQVLNKRNGTQLSMWSELWKLVKGPTGWILLIGSVMPALLEAIPPLWRKITEAQGMSEEQLQSNLETLREYYELHDDLAKEFGDDPLNVLSDTSELEHLKNHRDRLQEIKDLESEITKNRTSFSIQSLFPAEGLPSPNQLGMDDQLDELEELEKEAEESKESLGALNDVDFDQLSEKLKSLKHDVAISEYIVNNDPALLIKQKYSQVIAEMNRNIRLQEKAGNEAAAEAGRRNAESYSEWLRERLRESLLSGNDKLATIFGELIDQAEEELEDNEPEEEEEQEEFDMSAIYEQRQKAISARNELDAYEAERAVKNATNKADKLEAIEERHAVKMMEIKRKQKNGEYETAAESEMAEKKLVHETNDAIEQLERDHAIKQMELENMRNQQEMDTASSYEQKISAIDDYYSKREDIIRRSTENEMELQKKLYQNDLEQNKKREKAKEQLENRKRELTKNYADFAVGMAQTVGQLIGRESRAQFQIQKVASASQAVINGYLAYTKTLAQGGFLAQPMAASALAMSLAKAGQIMSQSYDSARATGGTGTSSGVGTSYRGFDFGSNNGYGNQRMNQPFSGSNNVSNKPSESNQPAFPDKVDATFKDGFGKVVSEGMLELHKKNKDDLGYWK